MDEEYSISQLCISISPFAAYNTFRYLSCFYRTDSNNNLRNPCWSNVKMKINKGIKVRIYPNKQQQELLNKTFGCCRFLHNKMLEERRTVYDTLKEEKDHLYAHKYKTEKQYKKEFPFLSEVDSKALQSETRNLLQAFQNFFRGIRTGKKIGYPKFKSKKKKQTYTTYNINNNIRINHKAKRIKLPKIGWVKYRDDRNVVHPIKHVTVSRTRTNKYYVAIIIEVEIDVEPITTIPLHRIEAFDMSAPNFLINENLELTNPRFYRNQERKLKRLHKLESRKQKGSKNREKARLRLARGYEKIQNQKMDWTHKLTHSLSNQFDAIILEDLNIQGMQQFNSGLSKSVTLDFSWYQFISYLRYKLEWQGKPLVLVDRFFPSSKRCSVCGQINNDLQLSKRTWTCQCGATHHRDVNASTNIKEEGLQILHDQGITIINDNHATVGTTESHASGDYVRPALAGSGQGRRNPLAFRQW
ncbi:MAG: IS200/IS605 family element transposase accessory protein TnpB [Candidatus Helarchaeota archaeon]|nr:IS200/IS605 family element transposase accessory protein TnpB [Candidatus Helarchaeota archaeon]